MSRPVAEPVTDTDALADDAGTRAMVDLLLGTTALVLVVLLAVGAQALRQAASPSAQEAARPAEIDSLFAGAEAPVIFAGADGVRLPGSDRIIPVGEIARSDRLVGIARAGMPTLVIAPDGIEAAFHLTARLAGLGTTVVRRVRLRSGCAMIDKVEIRTTGWNVSCRRR